MSMNIDSNEFPVSGNVGDKIIINGIETVIKISFQLINIFKRLFFNDFLPKQWVLQL